jgi:hypothetical protein
MHGFPVVDQREATNGRRCASNLGITFPGMSSGTFFERSIARTSFCAHGIEETAAVS